MSLFRPLLLATLVLFTQPALSLADPTQFLRDIQILAADSLQGRLVGTPGSAKAQAYLKARFTEIGLKPWQDQYAHTFSFTHRDGRAISNATNLLAYIEGTGSDSSFIVITAHYDHLGERNGAIYNGSDDNASGVAGLLEIAAWFTKHPPETGILLAALDAEEGGLHGAKALVKALEPMHHRIRMNVNLDMISVSEKGELYAAGSYHYPFLKPVLEELAKESPVRLLLGHDAPDLKPGDDWTNASDHAAFHQAGIPFIYFGVEDHPWYHTPQDTFDKIHADFAYKAATTIRMAIERFTRLPHRTTN
jgi:Zn-dependent M28 family amino/carboxypeptidase